MVICPNCGEENRKDALYCHKCGEKLQTSMYVKHREPWGIVHIGVVLLSVLLMITAFGLIMSGTSVRSIQEIMTDDEGYITSTTKTVAVPSYGIVVDEVQFEMDEAAWWWFKQQGGFLSFKVTTTSNDPSKEIFVGVAPYGDAYNYIDPMEYHSVQNLDMGWEPARDHGVTTYVLHSGEAPSTPPGDQGFWIVQGSSAGVQTITWEPEAGNYYVVLMNADGSPDVSADIKLGVQVPFFGSIGDILLSIGVVVGVIGVLMLYFTIKRNQP